MTSCRSRANISLTTIIVHSARILWYILVQLGCHPCSVRGDGQFCPWQKLYCQQALRDDQGQLASCPQKTALLVSNSSANSTRQGNNLLKMWWVLSTEARWERPARRKKKHTHTVPACLTAKRMQKLFHTSTHTHTRVHTHTHTHIYLSRDKKCGVWFPVTKGFGDKTLIIWSLKLTLCKVSSMPGEESLAGHHQVSLKSSVEAEQGWCSVKVQVSVEVASDVCKTRKELGLTLPFFSCFCWRTHTRTHKNTHAFHEGQRSNLKANVNGEKLERGPARIHYTPYTIHTETHTHTHHTTRTDTYKYHQKKTRKHTHTHTHNTHADTHARTHTHAHTHTHTLNFNNFRWKRAQSKSTRTVFLVHGNARVRIRRSFVRSGVGKAVSIVNGLPT